MTLVIKPVTGNLIDDLARLFSTEKVAKDCWCMWFIRPVKEFHSAGSKGNRAMFCELAAESSQPLGLIAYQDNEPVGWCAAGQRSRYVRALKTPTYRERGLGQDSDVWLVPCIFVRKEMRSKGVSKALLNSAVELARKNNATAIEGFPFSGSNRRSSGDLQVGFEALFSTCGFKVIRTPSTSRVVMRRELKT
jgi:GNAT superfamily N-acetyltransferase